MTDPRPLAVPDSPVLLLLVADARTVLLAEYAWQEADLTVRRVRGRTMRTLDALFDEFAAALQFPPYFGENWAAFDESWDRPAVPFHVVLHAQSGEAEETSRRWVGAGAHVVPFA